MRRIAPGIYLDSHRVHFRLREMCEHAGLPYTRANCALILALVSFHAAAPLPESAN